MQRHTCNNTAGSQATACAACKHQRKKCSEACILAPYFPAERNKEFQAVHKVFGVSNVKKMVKNMNEEERRRVVDTLIWEASCRQKDPILGPYAEYRKVFDELKIYKSQENDQLMLQRDTNYKSLSGLVRWNNSGSNNSNGFGNGGIVNNNIGLSYFNDQNGRSNLLIDHSNPFSYCSNYNVEDAEQMRQEKNSVESVILLQQQQQQHSNNINGFNQQYYVSSGHQYNQVNQGRIQSTVWESSS